MSIDTIPYIMFFIFGLLLMWMGIRIIYLLNTSTQWPKVTGKVISSSISNTGRGGYRPRISFEYMVSGQSYVSKSYAIMPVASYFKSAAKRIKEKYQVGRVVDV